ncbi:hypothetical protein CVT25_003226 [Psilocybe cyanescens]|uniref:Uncharacterized protein n=1 Tax=Psilocybe cyanescens TaxID=93625 RepID=A0A409WMF3_PSICY|nr:hypothetical protein CVT25_003226 [Psilocybe cyanescens]
MSTGQEQRETQNPNNVTAQPESMVLESDPNFENNPSFSFVIIDPYSTTKNRITYRVKPAYSGQTFLISFWAANIIEDLQYLCQFLELHNFSTDIELWTRKNSSRDSQIPGVQVEENVIGRSINDRVAVVVVG